MVNRYENFIIDRLLSKLDESIIYYSDDFIETLIRMNTSLSKRILSLSEKDLDSDINFIDVTDSSDKLSFIPDARSKSMVETIPPPDTISKWRRVELLEPGRAIEYNPELFAYFGINHRSLPPPKASTIGWVRTVIDDRPFQDTQNKYWHFKADLDDPNFIDSVDEYKDCADTDDHIKQDSFYQASHYNEILTSPFRDKDPYKELTKVSKNRNPIKIGRLIARLLQISGDNPSSKEIEEFVNKYKSTYTIMKDKFRNFKLVSGEEIKRCYLYKNYAGRAGTLGSSCMRYEKCQNYFNIYTENPKQVKLLVLTDPITTKVLGRALVWNTKLKDDNIVFMDRIYTYLDSDLGQFIEYAKEHGWPYKAIQNSSDEFTMTAPSGNIYNPTLVVELEKTSTHWQYPYMDTFKHLNAQNHKISNYQRECWLSTGRKGEIYFLESQDGSNGYCENCNSTGRITCADCNGTGRIGCEICDGTGRLECGYCAGTGKDENEKECVECRGRGTEICDDCSGRGSRQCSNCNGNGEYECEECN